MGYMYENKVVFLGRLAFIVCLTHHPVKQCGYVDTLLQSVWLPRHITSIRWENTCFVVLENTIEERCNVTFLLADRLVVNVRRLTLSS